MSTKTIQVATEHKIYDIHQVNLSFTRNSIIQEVQGYNTLDQLQVQTHSMALIGILHNQWKEVGKIDE